MSGPRPCEIRPLGDAENDRMMAINRACPIRAEVTVCFDREPDFFLVPRLHFDEVCFLGAFREDELIGYGMVAFRTALVNGAPEEVFYIGDVRVLPEHRGSHVGERMAPAAVERILARKARLGYGVVKKGNRPAEHYVGALLQKHLFTEPLCTIDVRNLSVGRPKKTLAPFAVSRAEPGDVGEIVRLLRAEFVARLFAPDITEETWLAAIAARPNCSLADYFVARKDGRVVGVLGTWDTSPFKRTVIQSYTARIALARIGYNLLAPLLGRTRIPAAGGALRALSVTAFATEGREAAPLEAMLRVAHNELSGRGYHFLSIAFFADDPLARATRPFRIDPFESTFVAFALSEDSYREIQPDAARPFLEITCL